MKVGREKISNWGQQGEGKKRDGREKDELSPVFHN